LEVTLGVILEVVIDLELSNVFIVVVTADFFSLCVDDFILVFGRGDDAAAKL